MDTWIEPLVLYIGEIQVWLKSLEHAFTGAEMFQSKLHEADWEWISDGDGK